MDKFIKALNTHFEANKTLFTDIGLPAVATIDKFRNQPLNPEVFDYFPLPALFVNRTIQWQKEGKVYNGIMNVEFHVVQDATWPTENFSTNINQGLKQYTFLSILRFLLDDFESENTSKLQRSTETPVDADVSVYDMLVYSCTYYDPSVPGKLLVDTEGEELTITKKIVEKLKVQE